jgi:hypothetical protein
MKPLSSRGDIGKTKASSAEKM